MGIGAGGKIMQQIEEDENDSRMWDLANSKMLNVQIINSVDFHNITGFPPPPTPIDAQTYADQGLPFYKLYQAKSSKVTGAFDGIKGVVQAESEQVNVSSFDPEADIKQKSSMRRERKYPEEPIEIPIKMLDIDDTLPPFKSINEPDHEWDESEVEFWLNSIKSVD